MKKTRVWPALLAALVILAGCAAAPPEESDPPTEEFVFTRENMPRLNGSTSAVPLAEAVCSVLLGESREEVADLVQFSRTTASYEALMAGEADLLLAGEPEQAVMERLEAGDRWLLTPFATDALVFVVNADNPVNGLTTEQLQKIYTGEITNWSQVGGEDRDIIPFQRNPEAGSQALMKKLVMDGLEMMEPPVDYTAGSMSSLLEGVRQYDNSPAAIGYTVYYYAHDMEMAQGLKLLPEVELNSNDLLIDLAEIGLGIACIPDYMLRNRPGLEPVHLKTPLPARSAVIAHHEALQLSQAAQCFLKYFSQI